MPQGSGSSGTGGVVPPVDEAGSPLVMDSVPRPVDCIEIALAAADKTWRLLERRLKDAAKNACGDLDRLFKKLR